MHNNYDDKRQHLLAALMACGREVGSQVSKDQLLQPWWRLSRHLSPLIGENGFCALYGRAGRLVTPNHAWLAVAPSYRSIDSLVAALGDIYANAGTEAARTANAELLNTFTKLLCDLIGEALTIRLLHSAAHGEGEQKHAQEQK